MRISLIGGGAKLHLKPLFHGHYGKFFVSGRRYRHIFKYFEIIKKNDIEACKNNCNPELAAPLATDVKEAYKGGGSQSISGACHRQKCATICTVSGKEVLDKVGWAFSPTMKLCWGRNHNLQKAISYASRTATRHVRGDLVPAFTLAEVLITLGIIGIVAAMTLPALINNANNAQYKAQLQKAYSVIQQALMRLNTDQGFIATQESYDIHKFAPAIKKYLVQGKDCGMEDCKGNGTDDDWGLLLSNIYITYNGNKGYNANFDEGQSILANGMFIMIDNDGLNPICISVDINGYYKRPNRFGYDVFMFQIDNKTGKLLPMGMDGTRYPYSQFCSTTSTSNRNGLGCTIKAITDPNYFRNLPK